jgi:hypothetical protein
MKYSLKPLTNSSWLLLEDGNRIGLVNEIDNRIVIIGRIEPKEYENIESLRNKLGGKLDIEEVVVTIKEPELGNVGGFPVKHATHFNPVTEPIPSYTRTAKSKDLYAAGYYALKFSQGWTYSFCPRLSTLVDYEYIGPFTTKLEMQHQAAIKNREKTS